MDESNHQARWHVNIKKVVKIAAVIVAINLLAMLVRAIFTGPIRIDERLLDQLRLLDGEVLKANLERQYGCDENGLFYKDETSGEFCRLDEQKVHKEGVAHIKRSFTKAISSDSPSQNEEDWYIMQVWFEVFENEIPQECQEKGYVCSARYDRGMKIHDAPWWHCPISFDYETKDMSIFFRSSDSWGRGDKIEEQIKWLIEMGANSEPGA
jgi:hypothetical protein